MENTKAVCVLYSDTLDTEVVKLLATRYIVTVEQTKYNRICITLNNK